MDDTVNLYINIFICNKTITDKNKNKKKHV